MSKESKSSKEGPDEPYFEAVSNLCNKLPHLNLLKQYKRDVEKQGPDGPRCNFEILDILHKPELANNTSGTDEALKKDPALDTVTPGNSSCHDKTSDKVSDHGETKPREDVCKTCEGERIEVSTQEQTNTVLRSTKICQQCSSNCPNDQRKTLMDDMLNGADSSTRISLRIVFVEGITPPIMEILGARFRLDPEYFAEYLSTKPTFAQKWVTKGLLKPFITLQWYRPVLVDSRYAQMKHDADGKQPEHPKLNTVCRDYTKLSMDFPECETISTRPIGSRGDNSDATKTLANYDRRTYSAWKEKLSIHFEARKQYDIPVVVVLIDPVPQFYLPPAKKKLHLAKRFKDTFKNGANRGKKKVVPDPPSARDCFRTRRGRRVWNRSSVVDTDPFSDSYGSEVSESDAEERSKTLNTFQACMRGQELSPDICGSYRACIMAVLNHVLRDTDEVIQYTEGGLDALRSTTSTNYIQLLNHVEDWQNVLREYRRISDTLLQGFGAGVKLMNMASSAKNVQNFVFTREMEDWSSDHVLDGRYRDGGWRVGSWDFQNNPFAGSLAQHHEDDRLSHPLMLEQFKTLSKEFQVRIAKLQYIDKRITESINVIYGAVSLAESNRQIGEAEAVTKLTELAFFFVPISFSATLFGMQVKEFGDGGNQISIYVWVYTAVACVGGAYLVRLLIRSRPIKRAKVYLKSSVRRLGSVPETQPIPSTSVLVAGVKSDISLYSFITCLATLLYGGLAFAAVGPIALIWTVGAHLSQGAKIAATVVFATADVGVLGLIIIAGLWDLHQTKKRKNRTDQMEAGTKEKDEVKPVEATPEAAGVDAKGEGGGQPEAEHETSEPAMQEPDPALNEQSSTN